ncbi:DNA primase large subunit [Spathaspora sp. JA1]|nr:DNA primase large subunit [Spathaspora sp. JA1]
MFRQVKRRTAGRRNFEDDKSPSSSPSLYKSRLSFYDIPPMNEITLEQFEIWAIDRLKILIEIESCQARSKSLKEIEASIKPLLLKYLPLSPSGDNIAQERIKDHYSHYILRLVFCRSEELRKKFIKNETTLFKVRYNLLQPKEQQEFIELYNDRLSWNYITPQEKQQVFDQLFAACGLTIKNNLLVEGESLNNEQLRQHILTKENFIKLPFEKCGGLVGSRSIFLSNGYGYLPSSLQLNLLAIEFQENLNQILLHTFHIIPRLEEDDRILPLLNNMSKNFANIQYDQIQDPSLTSDINAQSVTTEKITQHFPLCGKHLQNSLIANSHLKYNSRQQFGLFLKGIGLNVDEALKYWSHQFTKSGSISLEKFNKEYKYNIRHQYGLEGARINYKPWDCGIILSKPKPGKGDSHGCPYRDFTLDSLVNNLQELGITDQQELNSIMDDVNKRDYTIACTRVFEFTHKKQLATAGTKMEGLHINHPNLYFDRSRQLAKTE